VPLLTTGTGTKKGVLSWGTTAELATVPHNGRTGSMSWHWEREGTRKEQHTTGEHLKQEMREDDQGSPLWC